MDLVRTFTIQRKPDRLYWLTGAPRNWRHGDNWLIAHDVFHHFQGDTGSVEHEVMSFGVECWLESPKVGLALSVSPGTLAGTLDADFDPGITARRLARLLAAEPPARELPPVAEDIREFLNFLVQDGFRALMKNLGRHRGVTLPPAAIAAILSADNLRRHASWVVQGYARAKVLYPDAEAFHRAFETLQNCVQRMGSDDHATFSLTADAGLVAENRAAARCVNSLLESGVEADERLYVRRPQGTLMTC